MVVSESTDSSCWHKCTIGADRGGEIFDMLPRRGVGPVVPVPESAVDQFSGLSGARPQSGFAGKASVLRTPLSSCPGLWPPFAVSSGLMHSHQYLLDVRVYTCTKTRNGCWPWPEGVTLAPPKSTWEQPHPGRSRDLKTWVLEMKPGNCTKPGFSTRFSMLRMDPKSPDSGRA